MAKKYQSIETKIHPMTWIIMGLILVSLLTLFFAVQPTEKDLLYTSYETAAQGDSSFGKKLPEDNKIHLLKSLDNEWFNEGLISLSDRDDQLTIVYFGNSSVTGSSLALANAYAYLYGAAKADVAVSSLFEALGDSKVKFYHYEATADQMNSISERLNDKFDDLELNAPTIPYIIAFYNGEVLEHGSLTQSNVPQYLKYTFYKNIFEHDSLQSFLN